MICLPGRCLIFIYLYLLHFILSCSDILNRFINKKQLWRFKCEPFLVVAQKTNGFSVKTFRFSLFREYYCMRLENCSTRILKASFYYRFREQWWSVSRDGCSQSLVRAEKDEKWEHSPPITVILIKCSQLTKLALRPFNKLKSIKTEWSIYFSN